MPAELHPDPEPATPARGGAMDASDIDALAEGLHDLYAPALCISDLGMHEWAECDSKRQWLRDAATPPVAALLARAALADELAEALRLVMTCDQDKPDQLLPAVDAGYDALAKWEASRAK